MLASSFPAWFWLCALDRSKRIPKVQRKIHPKGLTVLVWFKEKSGSETPTMGDLNTSSRYTTTFVSLALSLTPCPIPCPIPTKHTYLIRLRHQRYLLLPRAGQSARVPFVHHPQISSSLTVRVASALSLSASTISDRMASSGDVSTMSRTSRRSL